MLCMTTTPEEIFAIIHTLKMKNFSGIDGVSAKVVKYVAEEIATPAANLFNRSIEIGIFPNIFELARIIPIHKEGDRTIKENYRPISALSIFSFFLKHS